MNNLKKYYDYGFGDAGGNMNNENVGNREIAVKRFFHELSREEIDTLIKEGKSWQDIADNYLQPSWCLYPNALHGKWGCYSLTDLDADNPIREKICEKFCSNCELSTTKPKNNE